DSRTIRHRPEHDIAAAGVRDALGTSRAVRRHTAPARAVGACRQAERSTTHLPGPERLRLSLAGRVRSHAVRPGAGVEAAAAPSPPAGRADADRAAPCDRGAHASASRAGTSARALDRWVVARV